MRKHKNMQCSTNPMTLSHTLPPTCSMRRSLSCTLLCEAEQGCLVSSPSAQLWSRPKVFHEGNIICYSKRLQQLQHYIGFWSKIHYVKSTLRVQHYVKQNQPLICSLKLSDFLLENNILMSQQLPLTICMDASFRSVLQKLKDNAV